jgi:hypothetical protein
MRSLRASLLVFIVLLAAEGQAFCQSLSQSQGQSNDHNNNSIFSSGLSSGPGPADGTKIALSSGASAIALTDEARELANELNLPALLANLDQLKTRVQNAGAGSINSLDALAARQELLEARQEYEKRVLKASLEVDYVLASIDGEQHRFEQMRADLESNRDTSVLLTNIAGQVSNGILWVLSCSFSIASETKPQYNVKDGVNGIVAGALPSILGLYALYQLRGPSRKLPANPNMLAPLLGTGQDSSNYYPKSVLNFLNANPTGQSTSRRQLLISQWAKSKSLSKPDSKNYERSAQIISGTLAQRRALTISLISKQQIMLSDLRAQVCSMKRGLLELMPALD